MEKVIGISDVVALRRGISARKLKEGQVGTVVEVLAPGVYEVEFADEHGRTTASLAVSSRLLLKLEPSFQAYVLKARNSHARRGISTKTGNALRVPETSNMLL